MNNLNLDNLDENDISQVKELIKKLISNKKPKNNKSKQKSGRKGPPEKVAEKIRQRKKQNLDKTGGASRIIINPEESEPPQKMKRRHFAQREQIELGKSYNKFLDMPEAKSNNLDKETDILLRGGNKIRPAKIARSNTIEVRCTGCNKVFNVSPKEVFKDPDEEGLIYTCNSCCLGKGKGQR